MVVCAFVYGVLCTCVHAFAHKGPVADVVDIVYVQVHGRGVDQYLFLCTVPLLCTCLCVVLTNLWVLGCVHTSPPYTRVRMHVHLSRDFSPEPVAKLFCVLLNLYT